MKRVRKETVTSFFDAMSNKSRLIGYGLMNDDSKYVKKLVIKINGESSAKVKLKMTRKLSSKVICYDTLDSVSDALQFLHVCGLMAQLMVVEIHDDGGKMTSKVWQ